MSVRAAVMEAPGRMDVSSFPVPDPKPGAVVLRIDYSGICGTDKHTWRGETVQYAGTEHEYATPFPIILGHENVGVVEAVGPAPPPVDEAGVPVRVGDRVVPAPNVACGRCAFCVGRRI
jgi:threonine dehydrogenase-like Zn-dependent dehydrogenase